MKVRRVMALILGIFYVLSAGQMLVGPAAWYEAIPGVTETGPYNFHFVTDIGLAFLATSLAMFAFAANPRLWPAALAGALFPVFHAAFHLLLLVLGHSSLWLFDLSLVVLPAALALGVSLPSRGMRSEIDAT